MKNIVLIFLSFVLLASCKSNKIEVSGSIANAAGKQITLFRNLQNILEVVDTVMINQSGMYKLKGEIDHSAFFYLGFEKDRNYIQLIISPGENVKVNGDFDNFQKDYTIEGSEESIKLNNLNKALYSKLAEVEKLREIFNKNLQNPKLQVIKDSLDRAFDSLYQEHRKFVINFIESNPKSMSIIVALSHSFNPQTPIIHPENDFKYYEFIDSCMQIYNPKSDQVVAFHKFTAAKREEIKAVAISEKLTAIGNVAPNFTLKNPKGDDVSLSSLRGKVVLIDFWASWCKPCRNQNPELVDIYKKYGGLNFEIFQVSLDDDMEAWTKAIDTDSLGRWVHVSDLKKWNSEPAIMYNVKSIPSSLLLDKYGRIVAKNLKGSNLESHIKHLLQ